MDYIRFAIQNPVKVTVGVLLLLMFGLICLARIPIQLTPNIDPSVVTIVTEWVGRSPEEIESEIIEPQEDVLKNAAGLVKMTAVASPGRAEIKLEFIVGKRIDDARNEVSDSLRRVAQYPQGVDEPVITKGEANAESPAAWLIFDCDDPKFDVQSLGDPVEDRIKPRLEGIDGVSQVRVYGGRARQVHIEFDPRRMAQRGITFDQLRTALRLENVNISAGDMQVGQYDYRVRTVSQYDDLDDIRKTIVAYTDGGPVRITDLATVRFTYEKRRMFVRARPTRTGDARVS
jgi:HAE1 family hydrophobic/amphiphilic exporter-1